MKTRIVLFVIVLLSNIVLVSGQSINPESEWRVNSSIWEPGCEINYRYYKAYIEGDTILNSKQYYKVYQSGYGYIDWIPEPYYYYFDQLLFGFLREENNSWYTFYYGQDKLLYDFNLQVNDTIVSAYTFSMDPIIITAIDSILIDYEYRKRFNLSVEFGAEYIIEGIGATSGLFENMEFFEWESELICYAKDGTSFWGVSTEECDLDVSILDNNKMDQNFIIYPNPAKNYIKILTPSVNNITHMTLVNTMGTVVLKKKFLSGIFNIISLNNLPPGIYFVIIENEFITQTKKLMVE